jgi:hypothetical protein
MFIYMKIYMITQKRDKNLLEILQRISQLFSFDIISSASKKIYGLKTFAPPLLAPPPHHPV